MKPDTTTGLGGETGVVGTVRRAPEEVARLEGPRDASLRTYRLSPSAELAGVVRRFQIPIWSVPAGTETPQSTLQEPTCSIVITADDARFYGVAPELSTTTLLGDGWAVAVVLAPATGYLLSGPGGALNDRFVDLTEVMGDPGRALADLVRSAMATDPHAAPAHRAATAACEDTLRRFVPLDAEGELVNDVVAAVEDDLELQQVAQICERFGIGERALQRLLRRRLGLTPKCLLQRRRLQEAAERLGTHSTTQADLAAAVGYADQSHMIRDFLHITGTTPRRFQATRSP